MIFRSCPHAVSRSRRWLMCLINPGGAVEIAAKRILFFRSLVTNASKSACVLSLVLFSGCVLLLGVDSPRLQDPPQMREEMDGGGKRNWRMFLKATASPRFPPPPTALLPPPCLSPSFSCLLPTLSCSLLPPSPPSSLFPFPSCFKNQSIITVWRLMKWCASTARAPGNAPRQSSGHPAMPFKATRQDPEPASLPKLFRSRLCRATGPT